MDKRTVVCGCVILILLFGCEPAAADTPNLLFILSDDHRHDFLGCANHPILKTPTIDALAADGVRFRNAFVTTSICAASRATILTGLTERSHAYTFGTPKLHPAWVTSSYPACLRDRGYRTGLVGKFGVNVNGDPNQTMFDWFAPLGRNPYVKTIDGQPKHLTDLIGDRAIEFVTSTPADQPFCLSISFNAAHAEDSDKANHYPPPPTESDLYQDTPMDQPRLVESFADLPGFLRSSMNRQRWFWRWDTPEKYERNVRNYYRMITGLDRNIGRVLEAIGQSERADNTVVIFMGDNGYYKGDRGLAGKWSHFEESLRVPLVIYDPRYRRPDESWVVDAVALNLDIAPTLLDLAGVEVPGHYQGRSLVPLIQETNPPWERESFTCEHLMEHPAIPKWQGMRTPQFTYANYFSQDPPVELLYDRNSDPDQLVNVANRPAYEQTLQKLRTATEHALAEQASIRKPN